MRFINNIKRIFYFTFILFLIIIVQMNIIYINSKEDSFLPSLETKENSTPPVDSITQIGTNCLENVIQALSNPNSQEFLNAIKISNLSSSEQIFLFSFCIAEEKEESFLKAILDSESIDPVEINRTLIEMSREEWFKNGPMKKVLPMIDGILIEKEKEPELSVPLLIERMIASEELKNDRLINSLLEKLLLKLGHNKNDVLHQLLSSSIENKWYLSIPILLKHYPIEEKEYRELLSKALQEEDVKLLEHLSLKQKLLNEKEIQSIYTTALIEKAHPLFFQTLLSHYPISSEGLSELLCNAMENEKLSSFATILQSGQQILSHHLMGILTHAIYQEKWSFVEAICSSHRYLDSELLKPLIDEKSKASQMIEKYCEKQEKIKEEVYLKIEEVNSTEVRKKIQDFVNNTPPSSDFSEIYEKIAKDYKRMDLEARTEEGETFLEPLQTSYERSASYFVKQIETSLAPLMQSIPEIAKQKILANFNQDLVHPFVQFLINQQEILIDGKEAFFSARIDTHLQGGKNRIQMIVSQETTEIRYLGTCHLYNPEAFPIYFFAIFRQQFDNETGDCIDCTIEATKAPFSDDKTLYT